MFHEYQNGTHRHYNGAILGRANRIGAWELAEMQGNPDDSRHWEELAKSAMDAMTLDFRVDDGLFNGFNDLYNLSAHKLTWKQIFYIWRVAHLTVRLEPSIALVDLVREAGLDLA